MLFCVNIKWCNFVLDTKLMWSCWMKVNKIAKESGIEKEIKKQNCVQ